MRLLKSTNLVIAGNSNAPQPHRSRPGNSLRQLRVGIRASEFLRAGQAGTPVLCRPPIQHFQLHRAAAVVFIHLRRKRQIKLSPLTEMEYPLQCSGLRKTLLISTRFEFYE